MASWEHRPRSRRCIAPTLVTVLGLVAAGCGGPITDDELQRGVQTLGATAAEGRLVALDAVEDRTKVTFVRVEARDLGEDAEHEAEKLNDAEPQPGNARVKEQAVALAQDISSELGDLQVSPADRRIARRVQHRLDALARQADRLTERL
jgi:hypothetical protein